MIQFQQLLLGLKILSLKKSKPNIAHFSFGNDFSQSMDKPKPLNKTK